MRSTPSALSAAISPVTKAAGSRKATVGPGVEISAVSGVTTPMMPTFSPPKSRTTCFRASGASSGSRETSVLPESTGKSAVAMNLASGAGPRSNSWLP